MLPANALLIVFLLLELEDVLYEELLQMLVRVVDAQLFEAVCCEVLEAENVEHTDARGNLLLFWSVE